MREFNYYGAIKEAKWDSDILAYIGAIYKLAGKQELYLQQRPRQLEQLFEIAKIQSTEASNAIEGIFSTGTRIRSLVQHKTTPKNRNEQEIAGYRDALNIIHENYQAIPITSNYILQLHKVLYSHTPNPMAGKTKNAQNYINASYADGTSFTIFTPMDPFETPQALEAICTEFNQAIGKSGIEPLIAIPMFIHDFLCIHPFNDGNGRMSRLLTTLLLYRSGFSIGRYISLETIIADTKELYYGALQDSQEDWINGREDVLPFVKYMLSVILKAYRDFEDRYAIVEGKTDASQKVLRAAEQKLGKFTKQDILQMCPSLSLSSAEGALRKLTAEGFLKREGSGRATFYYRV